MLSEGGYSVNLTSNGQEALNELAHNSYDICIIDMQMPVMGGLEAVKTYKTMNLESKMPFIMLTANATTDAIEKGKKAGVDLFLTKPIGSAELLSAIDSIRMN